MTNHEASCSCGQLKAHVQGDPIRISICHCLACQKRSGSAFAYQARFATDGVTIDGESCEYSRTGDSGTTACFHFCPRCGSTVFYTTVGSPEFVSIAVGAFAEPDFPAPQVSVYEERQHAWLGLPENMQHFA